MDKIIDTLPPSLDLQGYIILPIQKEYFIELKNEIERLKEELEEAKEPCESPCSRGFELISENKGLRDRLKISIEYVDGIPTGYGEDEIDRQQAEIERLKDALAIANTTIANLHSEIKKLQKDNRTVTGALENMHMTESETVEELRDVISQLEQENGKLLGDRLLGKSRLMQKEFKEMREENEWLKEQLEIRGKEWKATKGLKELLSEDNEGSCKSCDKLADRILKLDTDKLSLEYELEVANKELDKLRQDIKNAEAWRANIGGKRIHELEREVRQLHSTIQGWLTANAPGGWIDHLRIENKRLRNLARDFYSDRYINEVLRDGLENRGTT